MGQVCRPAGEVTWHEHRALAQTGWCGVRLGVMGGGGGRICLGVGLGMCAWGGPGRVWKEGWWWGGWVQGVSPKVAVPITRTFPSSPALFFAAAQGMSYAIGRYEPNPDNPRRLDIQFEALLLEPAPEQRGDLSRCAHRVCALLRALGFEGQGRCTHVKTAAGGQNAQHAVHAE